MNPRFCSLHIGMTHVDPAHYGRTLSPLHCCKTDALAMKTFAEILGYDATDLTVLLNEAATVESVKAQLEEKAASLQAGDFFLITYSGHGGRMPQLVDHKDDDKNLKMNETWCLFNRQMLDVEFPSIWASFQAGVNVVVVVDSCHSGGSLKDIFDSTGNAVSWWTPKSVGKDSMLEILLRQEANVKLYYQLQKEYIDKTPPVQANVLQFAACREEEMALAGPFMSKFTKAFLDKFGEAPYEDYRSFFNQIAEYHELIKNSTGEAQTPMFNDEEFGEASPFFMENAPFTKTGEKISQEQLDQIKELTQWIKTGDVVEESNTGFIIDGQEFSDDKILELDKWKPITENATKAQSNKGQLYWQPAEVQHKNAAKAWDLAYKKHLELEKKGQRVFVEPTFYEKVTDEKAFGEMTKTANAFLQKWPSPTTNEFSWYMGKEFSQLAQARAHVKDYLTEKELPIDGAVRIGHIDTGIRYEQVAFQHTNINKELAKSFIPGETGNPAVDVLARERNKGQIINWSAIQRLSEQDFHGTATLAILAGGNISKEHSYDNFVGEIGAIPFAEIIPMRISETVALTGAMFNVRQFAQAIEYAISCGCHVVTMSMAGSPSRAWARVINDAYEAGCVVVSAAGNSWRRNDTTFSWPRPLQSIGRSIGSVGQSLLPKKLMYPARFARVIAATGITQNKEPYVFDSNSQYRKTAGGEFMQGNYGPQWAMDYALAGYTPNIPWAELDENNESVFLRSGGGTSSATPQVAAAAALYIAKYKSVMQEQYGDPNWRWAEATRQALFQAADASHKDARKCLGMGSIQAYDALLIPPPAKNKLKKNEKKARVFSGFATFLKQTFGKNISDEDKEKPLTPFEEMVELEALQILHRDPALMQYAEAMENPDNGLSEEEIRAIFKQIQTSDFASQYLKKMDLQ